jgi:hypothetical protein
VCEPEGGRALERALLPCVEGERIAGADVQAGNEQRRLPTAREREDDGARRARE